MFIDKDSIKVNSQSYGQYLLSAKYDYNKLWGSDTGRNLKGRFTGTLVGIFPKITMHFRKLTKAEMNIIAPVLDSDFQTVQYYDPSLNRAKTMETYTGDWGYENKKIIVEKQDGTFECSFISTERR